MSLTALLLGIIVGLVIVIVVLWRRTVIVQRSASQEPVAAISDSNDYKKLWSEAVNLLGATGQLTEEQIRAITPQQPKPVAKQRALPTGGGFSSDRRRMEIARAKAGLPPADNLEGMFSSDVRKVHEARIQYGTAE